MLRCGLYIFVITHRLLVSSLLYYLRLRSLCAPHLQLWRLVRPNVLASDPQCRFSLLSLFREIISHLVTKRKLCIFDLIFGHVGSHHFKNIHELLDGITLNNLLITLIAQEEKGAGADVDHDALNELFGHLCSVDYPHIIGHLDRAVKGCVPITVLVPL